MKGTSLKAVSGVMLAAFMLLPVLVLAGCKEDKNAGTASPAAGSASPGTAVAPGKEPLKVSITLDFTGKEQPKPDNPVLKAIEKYTNTDLQITHIASNDFCSKLPVMIASGDLPDVIVSCGTPNQSYLLNAANGGVFWDISPYIKEFKNLSRMPEVSYNNIKIAGKIFGIPRYRPISRYTYAFRKDWLDNLGLKVPASMDELYNVLKAFTYNDPDKNGKNDTIGITAMISNTAFSPDFGVSFGAPNNWAVKDGKFTKAEETPEYLEGLKFTKKLYDEKLLNQDFASTDRPKQEGEFENGKAGVISATTNTLLSFENRVKSHKANAKVDGLFAFDGPKGKYTQADRGSNGILMFPKSKVKSEDQLMQLLGFFDKLSDKSMADLLEWGIQGRHYELKDGKATITNQTAYDNEVSFPYKTLLQTVPVDDIKTPGIVNPIMQRSYDIDADNAKYAVDDPAMVLVSETWMKQGAELLQILNDAKVKFVMGKIDENGWSQAVSQFKKAGGNKVAEEYAAGYVKSQNKVFGM